MPTIFQNFDVRWGVILTCATIAIIAYISYVGAQVAKSINDYYFPETTQKNS